MSMGSPRPALSPVAIRLLARARRELQQGRGSTAMRTLKSVLALAPDNPEALRWSGAAAQTLGNHGEAADCFRRALAAAPDDPAMHLALGVALLEHGETEEGTKYLKHACELAPSSAPAWFNLGEALMAQAHVVEASLAFEHALGLAPTYIPARLGLARLEASRGRVEAAVQGFREVLRRDPDNATAWFGLSCLNTIRFDAEDAACLQRAFARADLPMRAHNLLGFALAKALEDQGDHGRAFELFRSVNAARRKLVKWDASREHERVEAILRVFAGGVSRSANPQRGRELIQIVSLPRSGASLVEQILSSHPEVEGANEIKDLPHVIDAETRRRGKGFPAWVPDATPEDWRRLGNEYLERTARWRRVKPRFTDKNLVNGYLVGATLAMLPGARVVIVRRDPLETCFACYRQCFSGYAGFAYDLDEMADYCIDFMRMTRFWLDKYPDRVFELEYETLVADPEPTIRRLSDFCGLPFHPACLAFHETSRVVLSAPSAAQVRQPLRRDTARAALYGDKLDHLRDRLHGAGLIATDQRQAGGDASG